MKARAAAERRGPGAPEAPSRASMPWTAPLRRGTGLAGQASGSRGRIEAVGEGQEVARVLVETRGAAGKRDGLAVVAGGLGLVAARLVDVAEALEAVDVVGEATHEVASSNFGPHRGVRRG